jgi:hypothetical protein
MLKCGERDLTKKLNKPQLSMDCRVKPGNDELRNVLAPHPRPSLCKNTTMLKREGAARSEKKGWCLAFVVRYARFATHKK